ncbi:pirin family protein [Photobacterium leiognathi]|uniref:pirin family protein n=1 Tax=Photobacterium leiognathi TaxID=553611 RepID=UPI0027384B0C|nr:pirin family protein [Photobacterium leiognathi]
MSRKIAAIRHGVKHGDIITYIDNHHLPDTNPFILWDHYLSTNRTHSELDFHGHSGIDAISYPVVGSINNYDSITGKSQIKSGDLQLTTCGRGMTHKSQMKHHHGTAEAFQMWTASPPNQQGEMVTPSSTQINSEHLPLIEDIHATTKVLIGSYEGTDSPVQHSCNIIYLDIIVSSYGCWTFSPPETHLAGFIYVRSGQAYVTNNQLNPNQMGIFEHSTQPIKVLTTNHSARFFIALGQPLNQPFITQDGSVHTSDENLTQALNNIKLCINTLKQEQ